MAENIQQTIPIVPLLAEQFASWQIKQTAFVQQWLQSTGFVARPDTFCLLPNEQGQLQQVVFGLQHLEDGRSFAILANALPAGHYQIVSDNHDVQMQAAIAWNFSQYSFKRYKKAQEKPLPKLLLAKTVDNQLIDLIVTTSNWVRDLINTPTEDMGPAELAQAAIDMAKPFGAGVKQIVGDELLAKNYPAIHTVGRASTRAPRLIDLQWGDKNAPLITLVGKGVCFDSGGLDIKSSSNMLLMKKDMGGAAHALGLARLIMSTQLPVRLRVLIPAVENVIAGNAYRPGDIITMRNGLTVEVGNTDAEGRLVLADALAEAVIEKPTLLFDFSTLTGAARVAVGLDIAALFSNNDVLADALLKQAQQQQDPIWRLPLYAPYRKLIDSPIADISNSGNSPYAGAITAALFLQEFIPANVPWAHFDFMAWNATSRPGKPEGGEVMTMRAVFAYLRERFIRFQ